MFKKFSVALVALVAGLNLVQAPVQAAGMPNLVPTHVSRGLGKIDPKNLASENYLLVHIENQGDADATWCYTQVTIETETGPVTKNVWTGAIAAGRYLELKVYMPEGAKRGHGALKVDVMEAVAESTESDNEAAF